MAVEKVHTLHERTSHRKHDVPRRLHVQGPDVLLSKLRILDTHRLDPELVLSARVQKVTRAESEDVRLARDGRQHATAENDALGLGVLEATASSHFQHGDGHVGFGVELIQDRLRDEAGLSRPHFESDPDGILHTMQQAMEQNALGVRADDFVAVHSGLEDGRVFLAVLDIRFEVFLENGASIACEHSTRKLFDQTETVLLNFI